MKKITLISGSSRKDSYNTKLLDILKYYFSEEYVVSYLDYSALPLFNEEIEEEILSSIVGLKQQVQSSDLIVIATPIYNGSYTGVLKNAIDWLSRRDNVFLGKPIAILGATQGLSGTIMAQEHLTSVLDYLGSYVMPKPRVYISSVYNLFDQNGTPQLPDETKELLKSFVNQAIIFEKKINSDRK